MTNITVYSGPGCPYCERAKKLLKEKGVTFNDINVRADQAMLEEMMQKSGGQKTIPQIFINGQHIGGYDDLNLLDVLGKLDPLLKS